MNSRNSKILEKYKSGLTLEELAKDFKVTRSRLQQIVMREMEKSILESLNINYYLSSQDKQMLKIAAHEEIKQISVNREKNKISKTKSNLLAKIRINPELQNLSNFYTLKNFAETLGVDVSSIKKCLPEIVSDLSKHNKGKWSRLYDKCQMCGTTSTPHKIKGYCQKCYAKSPYFKQMQRASFLRHIDKRKRRMSEYMQDYKNRPEVKERYRKINDELNFGGNRLKALERDDFKCKNCGLTQEQSFKKFGKDLFVQHRKGKENELENLVTVCQDCHSSKILELAREIGKENLFQKYLRLYPKKQTF